MDNNPPEIRGKLLFIAGVSPEMFVEGEPGNIKAGAPLSSVKKRYFMYYDGEGKVIDRLRGNPGSPAITSFYAMLNAAWFSLKKPFIGLTGYPQGGVSPDGLAAKPNARVSGRQFDELLKLVAAVKANGAMILLVDMPSVESDSARDGLREEYDRIKKEYIRRLLGLTAVSYVDIRNINGKSAYCGPIPCKDRAFKHMSAISGAIMAMYKIPAQDFMNGTLVLPIYSDVSGKEVVDCGEVRAHAPSVILALGQSNSANYGEKPGYASRYDVYNYYRGKCYKAADPLLGATGERASVWSRLGDLIIQNGLSKSALITSIGAGGSSVKHWARGGHLNRRIENAITELRLGGFEITHIMWHQGEADHGLSGQEYSAGFSSMLDSIREKGVSAPIYVSVATYNDGKIADHIRKAQIGLVNCGEKIYPGPDTDSYLTSPGDRYLTYTDAGIGGKTHISKRGMIKFARLWMDSMIQSKNMCPNN